jgi:hypothetical protein
MRKGAFGALCLFLAIIQLSEAFAPPLQRRTRIVRACAEDGEAPVEDEASSAEESVAAPGMANKVEGIDFGEYSNPLTSWNPSAAPDDPELIAAARAKREACACSLLVSIKHRPQACPCSPLPVHALLTQDATGSILDTADWEQVSKGTPKTDDGEAMNNGAIAVLAVGALIAGAYAYMPQTFDGI